MCCRSLTFQTNSYSVAQTSIPMMPRSKTLKDVHGTDVHGANAHGTIVHGSPWGKTAVFSQSSDDGPLDADVDHNAAMKRLRERLRENRRNILTAVGNTGTNARVMIIESPTIHHGGETLEHVNVRIRVQTMVSITNILPARMPFALLHNYSESTRSASGHSFVLFCRAT